MNHFIRKFEIQIKRIKLDTQLLVDIPSTRNYIEIGSIISKMKPEDITSRIRLYFVHSAQSVY
jgi:uncharacterized protein YeeX (DUF496 family)